MFKRSFIFLMFIILSGAVSGQKSLQINIKLDSTLILKKIRYQYYNGKRLVFLGDSVSKSGNITIQGNYYSLFATLEIIFVNKSGEIYFSKYLVNEKPAQIDLSYKPNVDQQLLNKRLVNVIAAYDTISNRFYGELVNYNKKENLEVYNFTQQHKSELNTSDSLKKVYRGMLRAVNQRTLNLLKEHSGEYFSFWYFQNEIAIPDLHPNSGADNAQLQEELNYLQTAFPKRITQSFEGMALIDSYQKRITPLNNVDAPRFTIKTIYGKTIKSDDLKGRFVLLDFWATWCGPCMQEIPFIKSLRDKYPESKLAIISVSRDKDFNKMMKVIKQRGMNWYHYFDKETDMSRLYGVDVFPSYFLLDEQGKIIYVSNNIGNNASDIKAMLDRVM